MTFRLRGLLSFCAGTSLTLTVACSGSFTTADDDATGGSSAGGSSSTGGSSSGGTATGGSSSGGASTGGASTGGASTGGASTGGASTGGTSTGGSVISGECETATDCVAVLDAAAPCYRPGCTAPMAASREDVAQNRCLVLWEARDQAPPADCASQDPMACGIGCAAPPSCVTPLCEAGQCHLHVGYSDDECTQNVDCNTLNAKRQTALDAARACNPDLDNIQCNATQTVADMCGCPFVVNETQPALVQAARDARAAWSAACPAPACPLALCPIPLSGSCGPNAVCTAN